MKPRDSVRAGFSSKRNRREKSEALDMLRKQKRARARRAISHIVSSAETLPAQDETQKRADSIKKALCSSEAATRAAALSSLSSPDASERLAAVLAITTLAAHPNKKTARSVLFCDSITPALMAISLDTDPSLASHAVWALANLAMLDSALKPFMFEAGLPERIAQLVVAGGSAQCVKNHAWALCCLTEGDPAPPMQTATTVGPVVIGVAAQYAENMSTVPVDVMADLLYTIGALLDVDQRLVAHVIDSGVVTTLYHDAEVPAQLHTPLFRLTGTLCALGMQCDVDRLLDEGLVPQMERVAADGDAQALTELYWTVSNIAAGSAEHVEAILDSALIQLMLDGMCTRSSTVQYEICYSIMNLVTNAAAQTHHVLPLVTGGVLPALARVIDTNSAGYRVQFVCLQAVQAILRHGPPTGAWGELGRAGGLVDVLTRLTYSDNAKLFELSLQILDDEYSDDE